MKDSEVAKRFSQMGKEALKRKLGTEEAYKEHMRSMVKKRWAKYKAKNKTTEN